MLLTLIVLGCTQNKYIEKTSENQDTVDSFGNDITQVDGLSTSEDLEDFDDSSFNIDDL